MKPLHTLFSSMPKPVSHLLHYTTLSPHQNPEALRILDLITPKTPPPQNHLRLIQSCMQGLVPKNQPQTIKFDEIPDRNESWDSMFFKIHKQGGKTEAVTLSCALSSSTCIENGVQLHSLAIKTGFHEYVYIGTCLITFYSKCGDLDDGHKVFEEMPVRNVVSWTAIIAGFAQNWELDKCLELYNRMRCSLSKPNDFTFTSVLSVCSGVGALGQGKSVHCQVTRLGFDSYVHVGNVLISMYSKCGNVDDAYCVFERLQWKDLVSWNSMIAGYAQHGFAEEAMDMFGRMAKVKVKPDGITFLNVLSSCRHAGLIERGCDSFDSMSVHGVEPDLDHYSCMVDLLGRNGLVKEAKEFIDEMPISPNAVIWGSLLSSCRLHGEVHIGIEAAENRLSLVPDCAATHVQLVNLYANLGCWEQAARVRKMMKDRGLKTNPGYSWIEVKNEVYRFRAEDKSSARVYEILAVIDGLVDNMRQLGYVPKVHEEELDL